MTTWGILAYVDLERKAVANSSGKIRGFYTREKARQFIRNHRHHWESCEIVLLTKIKTNRRLHV